MVIIVVDSPDIHDYTYSTDFTTVPGKVDALQLLIQPWICESSTHYGWVEL